MAVPCRALIIDDDPDMAFLAAETIRLANDGLVVAGVVHSGDEAMDMLDDADVIVLDLRMPGRNGLEVAADILAAAPGHNIVLFSAYFDGQTVRDAEQLGVRECVSKDAVGALPDVVRRWCPAA